MLQIIYPYRDRDLERLKYSFESLAEQTSKDFKVFFVDYGSKPKTAEKVKRLCTAYPFIRYQYHFTRFQPWNKSKALNSVIRNLESGFCFVADVDIIFHSSFVEKASALQEIDKSVYFQVGFTTEYDKISQIQEGTFSNFRKSTAEATGLTMFPVEVLKKLRGFDEFYHFWGAEDTDMHIRLRNAGYDIQFYDKQVLLLHQWHKNYRASETKRLEKELQIAGIVQLNHQHLKFAIQNNITKLKYNSFGRLPSKFEIEELQDAPVDFSIQTEIRQIDDFLYGQLPVLKDRILKVVIEEDPYQYSQKYLIKKLLRQKLPSYYSLKEVNDKVLLHLISFYRNNAYTYEVNPKEKKIILSIKL